MAIEIDETDHLEMVKELLDYLADTDLLINHDINELIEEILNAERSYSFIETAALFEITNEQVEALNKLNQELGEKLAEAGKK